LAGRQNDLLRQYLAIVQGQAMVRLVINTISLRSMHRFDYIALQSARSAHGEGLEATPESG